ncbi:transporter [Marinoscillum furvescens]|uniref:Outer membrane putative beta-barrel porin/alpha-amylase n=1 Tax=Marinoscillum furvescens DSM 4134 TaxID=1122208 RepID=A0A3D9L1T7_MARFU|nr:transporter [Marinoscillum furvescens]RED96126.1 outer membrane putative beta-barrel porin/alpha-amylase [Marinoscillum furvescens DSM 4134]
MKTRLIIFSLALSIGFLAQAGGGWVYGKNKGFFKLAQNVIRSPHFYDGDGNVIDIPTVSLYTSSLYAEYGITDRLNGVLYMPFFVRSTLNRVEFRQSGSTIKGDAISSFGDTNIGLKYGIVRNKPVVLAASLILGIPLGSSEVSSERILQTGDGEFNQMLMLEASHSISGTPLYASVGLGYNNRTNGFSDEVRIGLELGGGYDRIAANVKLGIVESLYNGQPNDGSNSANGVFSNNTEYVSITPELIYGFTDQFGVAASAGFAASGRRILASPNFSLGVFLEL